MKNTKLAYYGTGLAIAVIIAYILQGITKQNRVSKAVQYEIVKNWPSLPKQLKLGNPTGIGVDTNQNIVVFQRADRNWPLLGPMPSQLIQSKTIFVINRDDGKLINSWGDNLFIMPHGLTVDNLNNIWVTDVGLHQVFKFSHKGRLLLKLGESGVAGNDNTHFDKPTDIAVAKDGSFYVSDGYGNSRIIKFSAAGKYLFAWGKKGNKQGEFNIPHAVTLDDEQHLYVADRENNRIQKFDSSGRFLNEYTNSSFGSICSVVFDKIASRLFAVDDLAFLQIKHRGSDILVFDRLGNGEAVFGRSSAFPVATSWYHDLAVDKDGNIYVGDILGNTIQKFRKTIGDAGFPLVK